MNRALARCIPHAPVAAAFATLLAAGVARAAPHASSPELLRTLPIHGTDPGEFFYLEDMDAGPDGSFYVLGSSELLGSGVARYGPHDELLGFWNGDGFPGIDAYRVSVSPSGRVWVTDGFRAKELGENGSILHDWDAGAPWPFRDMAADDDAVYFVTDDEVITFGPGGSPIARWSLDDAVDTWISYSADVDPAGNLAVAFAMLDDAGQIVPSIATYDLAGALLGAQPIPDLAPGEWPCDLDHDRGGHVYVLTRSDFYIDAPARDLCVLSVNGELLTRFGEFGTAPENLRFPPAIAVGPRGEVHVADRHDTGIVYGNAPADSDYLRVKTFGSVIRPAVAVSRPTPSDPQGFVARPAPASLRVTGANPFRGQTELSLATPPAGGVVDVSVHDVSGRLIRRLVAGNGSAGMIVARWDGRDDSGAVVPGGVYFARLATVEGTATRKLVFLGPR